MTGLMVKDLCILRNRKNAFVLFIGILILMSVSSESETISSFIIGYGTMLFGIFAVSTLSYDEHDNGLPFLFTLPVSRKEYVNEKYLFVSMVIFVGWLLSLVVGGVTTAVRGDLALFLGDIPEMISLLPLFMAIVSVMILVDLKYGMEKSRYVMAAIAGVTFAIAMAAKIIGGDEIPAFMKALENMSDLVICLILVAVAIVIMAITYTLSVRIVEKKEF